MPPLPTIIPPKRTPQRGRSFLAPKKPQPVLCQWDGDAFVPTSTQRADCDRRYVVGQYYRMLEWEDRSEISHRHEFAWLREAWMQLPEHLADLYPSAEHLRKRALIATGFYDQDAVDCGTPEGALRTAAWIRAKDDFCLVKVVGSVVLILTAKSQSKAAMGGKRFQESKDAILDLVSDMIGVAPDQLRRLAGRAA